MPPQNPVAFGQTSSDVTALQNFLIGQGYAIPAGATGYFGAQTQTALQNWQTSVGITSSTPGFGTNYGPQSIAKATATNSSKAPVQQPQQSQAPVTQTQTPYVPPPVQQTQQPSGPVGASTQSSVASATTKKPLDKSLLASVTGNLGPGLANDPNQVHALQLALVAAGYMNQSDIDAQGGAFNYGPLTTAAVKAWQQSDPQLAAAAGSNLGFFGPISKSYIQNGTAPSATDPVISPTQSKTDNTGVTDGTPIPPSLGLQGGNSGISNMPADAFQNVVPQLKEGTPEYQAAMDKIDTAYYDVLEQQMNAKTEQDQQAAQYSWQTLKKNIETNLNVKLSDDAFQAWDQVQNIKNTFGQQNLEGSGLQNEATDDYLRKIRNADAASRTGAKSDEESKNMEYYTKFATPEQVKAFAASNPDLAKSWGLTPSDDIKNTMSLSALRAKYPGSTDEQLQGYISQVLDENGNYRSNLYQQHMMGNSPLANEGNVAQTRDPVTGAVIAETVSPTDTGLVDIKKAKQTYLKDTITNRNDAAVADAKRATDSSTAVKSGAPSMDNIQGTDRFASNSTPGSTTPQVTPQPQQQTSTPTPQPQQQQSAPSPTPPPPPPTPAPAPAPAATPKKQYGSVYDAYTATMGSFPAWNSTQRMNDAAAAGISGYTGTAAQNAQLLAYLNNK